MNKRVIRRVAKLDDEIISIINPIQEDEINDRNRDYFLLPPNQFAKKYRSLLFQPVTFTYQDKSYEININHCISPYCSSYGLPQKRYMSIKNKPSRYKLSNSKEDRGVIRCNSIENNITFDCSTSTLSNWSAATEISRLKTINTVQNFKMDSEYQFHREDCQIGTETPSASPQSFYKRGKSSSNSQKWQCKKCKKITNIMPLRKDSFSYHQKRNDVLYSFALALINRTPVKRTCEILGIGSSTYYKKLEWLYVRCLEFLERNETEKFKELSLNTVWLNTDKLQYNLNNVRQKGFGGTRYEDTEQKQLQTFIVVSADTTTRYVFSADVAYDWNIDLKKLEDETLYYKDDHLDNFSRKNAQYRFQYAPQPPSPYDAQSLNEYQSERSEFDNRQKYIAGLHINSTYTTFAQLWWIRNMIRTKEWRLITDDDSSIQAALFRVFSKEIRLAEAHHFLITLDRQKTLQGAFKEYQEGRKELTAWGLSNGIVGESISSVAYQKLKKELIHHKFYKEFQHDGKTFRKWAKNKLTHPIPSIDQGYFDVDCTTDLSSYEPEQIAKMILKVNGKATDAFMQQIRRRISILERPLVTARGDGKSYIYANFNPKYAQYAITILRTFYNFCLSYKSFDKKKLTPAQRLGLTDKKFTLKEIIYFK